MRLGQSLAKYKSEMDDNTSHSLSHWDDNVWYFWSSTLGHEKLIICF